MSSKQSMWPASEDNVCSRNWRLSANSDWIGKAGGGGKDAACLRQVGRSK